MRILIADDHALFRDSLRALLSSADYEVVGEAGDGADAVRLSWELKPDVVLMDLAMPGVDGLKATQQLAAELPEVKVVVLTGSDDDANLFEAIKSGAKGYLLKDLGADDFLQLLAGVADGAPAITPKLARRLLDEFARPTSRSERTDPDALTDREQEVLELMVDGITTNRKLAAQLEVSENTIKFHVRNILDKLHLHNRAEVVGYALRNRLVTPPEG